MKSQLAAPVRLSTEAFADEVRIEAARRPELCNLFEEVVVSVEEETQPGRKRVHGQSRVNGGLHVRDRVRKRKCYFLDGSRSRFADVIAADRDRVPFRSFLTGPGE